MAILYPYKAGSISSKALADALGIKRISHRNSKFKGNGQKVVINWGASAVPEEVSKCTLLNKPEAVAIAADKLKFFEANRATGNTMDVKELSTGVIITIDQGVNGFPDIHVGARSEGGLWEIVSIENERETCSVPPNTANKAQAVAWVRDGYKVMCRTILNGNSGKGIIVATSRDELVDAPLYVKYIPKKSEYRVHVFQGKVIATQRKARRKDVPDDKVNWLIRNHDNGFIFARGEDLGEVPPPVVSNAIRAVKSCGLDFGAVDVIYNDQQGKAYVLEVNTAPGLAGTTLEDYVNAFKEVL